MDEIINDDMKAKLHKQAIKRFTAELKAVEKRQNAVKNRTGADALWTLRQNFLSSLITARYKQKLTQAELAEKAGMPRSMLARIESGRGNPSLDTLLRIADALGVKVVVE